VFINRPSKQVIAPIVADIRRRAAATGRNPAEILIFTMMTVITAATSDAARAKLEDYRSYVSEEGALVLMSGWTGLDFSKYGPDEPILHSRQDAQTSALEAFTIGDPGRVWTVREIAKHAAIGGRGPVVVGSPEEVADELIAWVEETDVDGFNLAYAVAPETFADFVDLVAPELQRRGRYKRDYAPGTLREKLYGEVAHGSAQIIQQSGSAILPICPAVDERVGRGLATPPSCWTAISRCWREISYSRTPPRGDRGFESLYPSKRSLAGRHCRLAEPGRPTGSSSRILCLEHLERTCTPAGRPRRKSRGRLRFERQYRD
jgi:hypothetical protein